MSSNANLYQTTIILIEPRAHFFALSRGLEGHFLHVAAADYHTSEQCYSPAAYSREPLVIVLH